MLLICIPLCNIIIQQACNYLLQLLLSTFRTINISKIKLSYIWLYFCQISSSFTREKQNKIYLSHLFLKYQSSHRLFKCNGKWKLYGGDVTIVSVQPNHAFKRIRIEEYIMYTFLSTVIYLDAYSHDSIHTFSDNMTFLSRMNSFEFYYILKGL